MFIEISKSGTLDVFNQGKTVCVNLMEGINEISIEVNDRTARNFKEGRALHIYYDKKESEIIVVSAQKHKEIQERDYKDPDKVYVGT